MASVSQWEREAIGERTQAAKQLRQSAPSEEEKHGIRVGVESVRLLPCPTPGSRRVRAYVAFTAPEVRTTGVDMEH
jgi:DNA invertase Pin-like site-specific DNA recombinase